MENCKSGFEDFLVCPDKECSQKSGCKCFSESQILNHWTLVFAMFPEVSGLPGISGFSSRYLRVANKVAIAHICNTLKKYLT